MKALSLLGRGKKGRVKIRISVGWSSGVGGGIFQKLHEMMTSRKTGPGWGYKSRTLRILYSESTPALIS